MPLSSIFTLKFRACENCELGFDNHKNFEEEEWHEHVGNSGEARNVGCSPLSSLESFPSPIFYSPIFAFKTSIASSMPAGFVPPA